jgi:hypothetical protein
MFNAQSNLKNKINKNDPLFSENLFNNVKNAAFNQFRNASNNVQEENNK